MKIPALYTLCFILMLLPGCKKAGSSDTAADKGAATHASGGSPETTFGNGTLSLRFSIDDDVAESMDMAPAGVFLGEIYNAEDVTGLGPDEGAVPLADFTVTLDLAADGTPSGVVYTTPLIEIAEVSVLGTLDVDESGDASGGDPITLPHLTSFDVLEGTSEVVVELNMLYPGG
jgi:hypothetical protein